MDPVNSVTQNSNNNTTKMENQAAVDDDDMKSKSNDNGNDNTSTATTLSMSPSSPSATTSMASSSSNSSSSDGALPMDPKSVPQVPDYLKAMGLDPKKFWPKKYRFTREKSPGQYNPLTIAQRNFYETNGYIVIDQCAPKKWLETISAQHKQSALINEFLVDKLVARNGKLLQYAKCFCDERLMLMTHHLIESFQTRETARQVIDNNRQVGQSPHQQLFRDWVYLPFRPIDKVCCALTAIEPLEHVILVVPGTHRVGQCTISSTLENISAAYDTSQEKSAQLRELFEVSPEKLSELVEKSRKGFKYVNLKAGQTLFYHPGLIHGFSNDLINFRKTQLALVAYYAAADCEYVDLRKTSTSSSLEQQQKSLNLPISLAHFGDKDPSDYTSWIDKPILLKDPRSANL